MPVQRGVSSQITGRAAGFDQVYLRSTHEARVLGEEAWTGPFAEQEANDWLRRLVLSQAPAWTWPVEAHVMIEDGELLEFRFMVKPRHAEPLRSAAIRHFHAITTDRDTNREVREAAGRTAQRLSGYAYRAAPSFEDWFDRVMSLHYPRGRRF